MTYTQIMKNLNTTAYAAVRAAHKENLDTHELRELAATIDRLVDNPPKQLSVIFRQREPK